MAGRTSNGGSPQSAGGSAPPPPPDPGELARRKALDELLKQIGLGGEEIDPSVKFNSEGGVQGQPLDVPREIASGEAEAVERARRYLIEVTQRLREASDTRRELILLENATGDVNSEEARRLRALLSAQIAAERLQADEVVRQLRAQQEVLRQQIRSSRIKRIFPGAVYVLLVEGLVLSVEGFVDAQANQERAEINDQLAQQARAAFVRVLALQYLHRSVTRPQNDPHLVDP